MTGAAAIYGVARADFLERVRRYSFLVTLLFAVYLGYAAATGKILLRLGDYRGVYTAGWIGLMVSLVTTLFVSLIGFYIVKNAVERDRHTRVGQVLAATPLSKTVYMLGKLTSNFAVLASIVLILALGAVAMFFLAAEDPRFDAWALLSPFLLIALPVMLLTASIALLFESIPLLRGGLGNVVWFFLWSFSLGLPEIFKRPWLDPLGMISSMQQVLPAAHAAIPNYKNSISLTIATGYVPVAEGLRFAGVSWTSHAILLRLLWAGVAILFVFFAALCFDRFDEARSLLPAMDAKGRLKHGPAAAAAVVSPEMVLTQGRAAPSVHLTPLARRESSMNFLRIFFAEARLALQGYRWWWYIVAVGLLIAQFSAPLNVSRGILLAVAWLWPTLVWSAMGARESRFGMRQLLFSCARIVPRQLLACWLAGVTIALLTGAGAAVRLTLAGQFDGLLAFCAAVLFIPALALALGVVSGSAKFFEALYTVVWYVGPLNHTRGLDFTGAVNGLATIRYALVYLALAAALLFAGFFARGRQLRNN